jgi:nicotinamide phosphoribosyltransferase
MIYGDSINLKRAEDILERLKNKGFASDNIVFGIGSYTYQGVTRDTYGTAMKATYGRVNGEFRELFKEPKTDNGTKKSARGLVRVEKEGDDFVLYDQQTAEQEEGGVLREIFFNGKLVVDECFETIRQRLYSE